MILKDGTKHACRSCITGHRSSKCVHSDRELFPIAKKGRPSNQCKACKERGHLGAKSTCECQLKRRAKAQVPRAETSRAAQDVNGGDPTTGDFTARHPVSRKGSESSASSRQSQLPSRESTPSWHQYATSASINSNSGPTHNAAFVPGPSTHSYRLSEPSRPAGPPSAADFGHPEFYRRFSLDSHADQRMPFPTSTEIDNHRPTTSGTSDAQWWLNRAFGAVGHADDHFGDINSAPLQQSPYYLGTPGLSQPKSNSPAFVWHQGSSLYRDYMALQSHQEGHQYPNMTNPVPSKSRDTVIAQHTMAGSSEPMQPRMQAPLFPPHANTWPGYMVPSMQQAQPGPAQFIGNAAHANQYNHLGGQSAPHNLGGTHLDRETWRDTPPGLTYDSGSSQSASANSMFAYQPLPTPANLNNFNNSTSAETEGPYPHALLPTNVNDKKASQSLEAAAGGQPPAVSSSFESFDQVIPRSTSLSLKLPEMKKARGRVSPVAGDGPAAIA